MSVLSRIYNAVVHYTVGQSQNLVKLIITGSIIVGLAALAGYFPQIGLSYGALLLTGSATACILNYTDIKNKIRRTLEHLHYQYFVPKQDKISDPFFARISHEKLSKQKIQAYINKGVNFNARDSFLGLFNTALIWGVANSNVKTVVNLLNCTNIENLDLDLNDFSKMRNTALTLSIIKGWDHVDTDSIGNPPRMLHLIKALVNAGANIHKANALGDTPLHIAVLRRDFGAINFLLEKGASLTILNKKGKSPIDMLQKSYPDMKEYISNAAVFTMLSRSKWNNSYDVINSLIVKHLKKSKNINKIKLSNKHIDSQEPVVTAYNSGRDSIGWLSYLKSYFSPNNYKYYNLWLDGLYSQMEWTCSNCAILTQKKCNIPSVEEEQNRARVLEMEIGKKNNKMFLTKFQKLAQDVPEKNRYRVWHYESKAIEKMLDTTSKSEIVEIKRKYEQKATKLLK